MRLCAKHDLLIMNDEIWSDILYPDAQFNSIYCLGEERCKRVLSVFGFSKSFGLAGLRIGCVYANDDEKFQKLVDASDVLSTAGGANSLSRLPRLRLAEETQEWRAAFLKHITKTGIMQWRLSMNIFRAYMPTDHRRHSCCM